MTRRNRVLTRDELLAELVSRAEHRAAADPQSPPWAAIGAVLDDLKELGADPVGQAKQLVDEEIG